MSHDEIYEKPGPAALHGLLAEYDSPAAIVSASKKIRDAGFSRWDTFTESRVDRAIMRTRRAVFPYFGLDPDDPRD